jgi:hypothetical protein
MGSRGAPAGAKFCPSRGKNLASHTSSVFRTEKQCIFPTNAHKICKFPEFFLQKSEKKMQKSCKKVAKKLQKSCEFFSLLAEKIAKFFIPDENFHIFKKFIKIFIIYKKFIKFL